MGTQTDEIDHYFKLNYVNKIDFYHVKIINAYVKFIDFSGASLIPLNLCKSLTIKGFYISKQHHITEDKRIMSCA